MVVCGYLTLKHFLGKKRGDFNYLFLDTVFRFLSLEDRIVFGAADDSVCFYLSVRKYFTFACCGNIYRILYKSVSFFICAGYLFTVSCELAFCDIFCFLRGGVIPVYRILAFVKHDLDRGVKKLFNYKKNKNEI